MSSKSEMGRLLHVNIPIDLFSLNPFEQTISDIAWIGYSRFELAIKCLNYNNKFGMVALDECTWKICVLCENMKARKNIHVCLVCFGFFCCSSFVVFRFVFFWGAGGGNSLTTSLALNNLNTSHVNRGIDELLNIQIGLRKSLSAPIFRLWTEDLSTLCCHRTAMYAIQKNYK